MKFKTVKIIHSVHMVSIPFPESFNEKTFLNNHIPPDLKHPRILLADKKSGTRRLGGSLLIHGKVLQNNRNRGKQPRILTKWPSSRFKGQNLDIDYFCQGPYYFFARRKGVLPTVPGTVKKIYF